jgi:hypothetical protein
MSEEEYFERQNEQDCTIHSFNNAFGGNYIEKSEILEYIEDVLQDMQQKGASESEIEKMRDRYSTGQTSFMARIVWEAAKQKGIYHDIIPVAGAQTPYHRFDIIFESDLLRDSPIIVLGMKKGSRHAIGIKNGRIFDSEHKSGCSIDGNKDNLIKVLSKIHGIYVFGKTSNHSAKIRRELKANNGPI